MKGNRNFSCHWEILSLGDDTEVADDGVEPSHNAIIYLRTNNENNGKIRLKTAYIELP